MKNKTVAGQIEYELHKVLGHGLNGTVYQAQRRDRSGQLAQTVAIKVLKSETLVESWKLEFLALTQVHHQACVKVFGFERIEGRPALILEFVDGLTLLDLLKYVKLTPDEIQAVVGQVHQGIAHLARHGMAHGDLSLTNVMVDKRGRVRLLDFGYGNFQGICPQFTREFAAPEILSNLSKPSYQSDLYSLGRILGTISELMDFESIFSQEVSSLCAEAAEKRWFPELTEPENESFEALAAKVTLAEHRRENIRGKTMEATQFELKTPARVKGWGSKALAFGLLFIVFLVFNSSGQAHSSSSLAFGLLELRTNQWTKLSINGEEKGYSPLAVPIQAEVGVQVQWETKAGRGERTLTLHRGERIVLDDRQFNRLQYEDLNGNH